MSRVAKAPVNVPTGVDIIFSDDSVTVKGPMGSVTQALNKHVLIKKSDTDAGQMVFLPASNDPSAWAHAGTMRAIFNNMVHGVTKGFEITLELVGVGYRAQAKDKSVTLSLGYSHPIEHLLPEGVKAETPNNTTLILRAIDKQLLGQTASEIISYRKPEPYKGKGIKKAGQVIPRKEAKKK